MDERGGSSFLKREPGHAHLARPGPLWLMTCSRELLVLVVHSLKGRYSFGFSENLFVVKAFHIPEQCSDFLQVLS